MRPTAFTAKSKGVETATLFDNVFSSQNQTDRHRNNLATASNPFEQRSNLFSAGGVPENHAPFSQGDVLSTRLKEGVAREVEVAEQDQDDDISSKDPIQALKGLFPNKSRASRRGPLDTNLVICKYKEKQQRTRTQGKPPSVSVMDSARNYVTQYAARLGNDEHLGAAQGTSGYFGTRDQPSIHEGPASYRRDNKVPIVSKTFKEDEEHT